MKLNYLHSFLAARSKKGGRLSGFILCKMRSVTISSHQRGSTLIMRARVTLLRCLCSLILLFKLPHMRINALG